MVVRVQEGITVGIYERWKHAYIKFWSHWINTD